MAHYIAIIHKDETSAYGVQFPDLPGCFSAADVQDDIVANAIEAMQLWAENQVMPEPRSVNALMDDPAVKEAMANNGYLMAIPYIADDSTTTRINVSLEAGLLRAIDEAATRQKLTRSTFIAQAVRKEVIRAA